MVLLPLKKRYVRLPRRSARTVFIAAALLFAVMCLIFPGFLSFASPVQIIIQRNTNNHHRHHFLSYKRNPVNEPEPLKGEDILMVCGSDGGHPLDPYQDLIKGNRQQYAALHGYNILFANFSDYRKRLGDAPKVWAKIPIIADAFQKYPNTKWLWWLDFDALIMTPTIDLGAHLLNPDVLLSKMLKGGTYPLGHLGENGGDGLIKYKLPETPDPNKVNFIISGDQNGLNAGSFFFRRCRWTSILLDLWIDPLLTHKTEWWALEQDALIHMLRHHHFIRHHMAIVPQRTINAYPGGDINSVSLVEKLNLTAGFWEPNDLVLHFAGCGAHNVCATWWDEYWPKCAGRKLPGWKEKNLPVIDPRSQITITLPKEGVKDEGEKDEEQKGEGKKKERKTAEGNKEEKIQETAEA